jgi:biotin synthase
MNAEAPPATQALWTDIFAADPAALRSDWTRAEIEALMAAPLFLLLDRARALHLHHHDAQQVQLATLANIKSGGCPENCGYCPQSAHFGGAPNEPLMPLTELVEAATRARAGGASRFCMGAAWRKVRDGAAFDQVVEMVRAVAGLGMEPCVTLGMLEPHQIARLRDAGLQAYNHNIDSSREYYSEVVSTRSYDDRLRTLATVRAAGVTLCAGGILGMGEAESDRVGLLHTLCTLEPHPESVPLNKLVPAAGTPLAGSAEIDSLDFVRVVAVARVLMPSSVLRLAAGRASLSREACALAFYAGVNSIFYGDRLLTTPNPEQDEDRALLAALGLRPKPVGAPPAA